MYEHMLTGCCISDEQRVGLDTRQDQVYSTITIISITAWSTMKQFPHQSPPPGHLVGLPVCISKCCVMFHACTLALIQCLLSTSTFIHQLYIISLVKLWKSFLLFIFFFSFLLLFIYVKKIITWNHLHTWTTLHRLYIYTRTCIFLIFCSPEIFLCMQICWFLQV
jgi:hypothetical protein